MKNLSIFQIIFLCIFVLFVLAGLLIVAIYDRQGSSRNVPEAIVWGSLTEKQFRAVVGTLSDDQTFRVAYVEKRAESFDSELTEALASGKGPDIVLLPQDSILRQSDRIFLIPFETIPERTFKDTFIEEGEMYLTGDGILAIPFSVDPMVMYWNRDIFSTAGIAKPPATWEELVSISPQLTAKDSNRNIVRSAVSLGEFSNISNAKSIISSLFFQLDVPIVERVSDRLSASLFQSENFAVGRGQSALSFYTQFADPLSRVYSWNRSLPLSRNAFLGGNVAIYFGFASEVYDLRAKNPNLNYDVALFPQLQDAKKKVVFGKMNALSVLKTSRDIANSIRIIQLLAGIEALRELSKVTGLPPARRDLLSERPNDSYQAIFYTGALQSHAWLDPDRVSTDMIFRDMVESVVSGKESLGESISRAEADLKALLQ